MNEINKIHLEISNIDPKDYSRLSKMMSSIKADAVMVSVNGLGALGEIILESDDMDAYRAGFDCEGCIHEEDCEYQDKFYNYARMVSMIESEFILQVDCPHYETDNEESEFDEEEWNPNSEDIGDTDNYD